MMKTAIILAAWSASCALPPPPLAHRVCAPCLGIGAAYGSPPELRAALASAVEYWGTEIEPRLCMSAVPDVTVSITPLESLARARIRHRSGCSLGGTVEVAPRALELPAPQLETVLRHELGHVLGFTHDAGLGLMTKTIDRGLHHPIEATVREVSALRRWYPAPARRSYDAPRAR